MVGEGVSGRIGKGAEEMIAAEVNGKAKGGVDCCPKREGVEGRLRNEGTVGADDRADKSGADEPKREEAPRG